MNGAASEWSPRKRRRRVLLPKGVEFPPCALLRRYRNGRARTGWVCAHRKSAIRSVDSRWAVGTKNAFQLSACRMTSSVCRVGTLSEVVHRACHARGATIGDSPHPVTPSISGRRPSDVHVSAYGRRCDFSSSHLRVGLGPQEVVRSLERSRNRFVASILRISDILSVSCKPIGTPIASSLSGGEATPRSAPCERINLEGDPRAL